MVVIKMEEYNRREIINLIDGWCNDNNSHWKGFANEKGVDHNALMAFKSQFNGNGSQSTGSILADCFGGKFVSTINIPKATFEVCKATSDAAKRKQTEKERKKLIARRAIEDHLAKREINKEFELH